MPSLGRRLALGTAVALVATTWPGISTATPDPAAPLVDLCPESSVLAEPAECSPAPTGATRAGAADRAPVIAGNAFADGLTDTGGGDPDKITFLPGDMTAPQQVANEPTGVLTYGYDFSVDGSVLYSVDNIASTLITVDQSTGAATVVGPMTKADAGHNWADVVVDPVTGAAYAVSTSLASYSLYALNLSTGATTLINTLTTSVQVVDMSMNCAGKLYATTIGDDSLYAVNPATGTLTVVGPTGVATNFAQGIDFDNATGMLHAWLYLGGGVTQYSHLDLTTGTATAFPGTVPAGEYEGAIRTACPAPPTTTPVDCDALEAAVAKAKKKAKKAKKQLKAAKATGDQQKIKKAKKKHKLAKKRLKKAKKALAAQTTCT